MPKKVSSAAPPTFYSQLNFWIENHRNLLLGVILGMSAVFIFLRFDANISMGGDDSWYILAAQDFWNGIAFPSWHGALYSILLSPLLALMGAIYLLPLKILSVIATRFSILILALAFYKRITPVAWLAGILLFAIAPQLVELASTTYSEPLFLLIQSFIFYVLFSYEKLKEANATPRKCYTRLAILAALVFLLAITRNVGYAAFLALVAYLLAVRREWKATVLFSSVFLVLQVAFSLYRGLWWGARDVSFSGQLSRVLQVDFYNAAAGQEDFWGMLVRFAQNCQQYLTGHNFQFLGMNAADSPFATVILILLMLTILIVTWKRSKTLALIGIYLAAMYATTFITQQVPWNQFRLVIVYFALFIFFLCDGFLNLLSQKVQRYSLWLVLPLLTIGFISHVVRNAQAVDIKLLRAHFSGDRYAGFTPDWESYLRMSEWVGENIPDSCVVACRKPNNSRIYGNRPFFGIFKLPSSNPDTIRLFLDSNRVDYAICARLRRYTERRTEDYINTMHIMLSIVLREKPDYLELVHVEGSSEPALLFKICRDTLTYDSPKLRERLETGLALYADNPEAYYRLARLSLYQRHPDEAREYILKAMRIFEEEKIPTPYPVREALAMVYFAKGNFRAAIEDFESLTTDFPQVPSLWYNLGICYAKVGDKRAEKCFQTARELAPQDSFPNS